MQEYEQFSRRTFFVEVVIGTLTAVQICEKASELNMDLKGPACFAGISQILSFRHLMREEHLLTKENTKRFHDPAELSRIKSLDLSKIDPAILRGFFWKMPARMRSRVLWMSICSVFGRRSGPAFSASICS